MNFCIVSNIRRAFKMMDGLKVLSACLNLVPKFSSQLAAPLIHLVRAIIELRDDVSKERFGPTRMDNFFKVKFKKPSIFKVDFFGKRSSFGCIKIKKDWRVV